MSNKGDGKEGLAIIIYIGGGVLVYLLWKAHSHIKWIRYLVTFLGIIWGTGGIIASQFLANEGVDFSHKPTRYILIFLAIFLLIIFNHTLQ